MSKPFERIVTFAPAYDNRDPDPKKNYGIHCVTLRMVLKGPLGAVQFVLYTGWYFHTITETGDPICGYRVNDSQRLDKPLPADLGYHSFVPMHEGQEPMGPCEYLNGKPCYYDGSCLNAERIFYVLIREGDEGVWRELEAYYERMFAREATHAD